MLNNMYPSGHCCCWCHTSSLVEVEFVSLWWRVEMNHSLLAAAGNVEPDVLIWFPVMKDICTVECSAAPWWVKGLCTNIAWSKICSCLRSDSRHVTRGCIVYVRWYTPLVCVHCIINERARFISCLFWHYGKSGTRWALWSSCTSSV